jgi:isoquinoline 1-oxidoreductase alpha subunit
MITNGCTPGTDARPATRRLSAIIPGFDAGRRPAAHRKTPAMIKFFVNGESYEFAADPETPLLWVLRDYLGLTGTKYGCGRAQCGACTVHVNGVAERSCSIAVKDVAGKRVNTIDDLGNTDPVARAVKAAWLDKDVTQCGYCQPGQVMSAVALLSKNKSPTDAQIDEAMEGNLCRCGTYPRIREAVKSAAAQLRGAKR